MERANKEVEYQVRTMKSVFLDDRVRGRDHQPVGLDGKTAYERLKGKASKMQGMVFVKFFMFRRVPLLGKLTKLESLREKGSQDKDHPRVPDEECWDRAVIEEVKVAPWRVGSQAASQVRGSEHP